MFWLSQMLSLTEFWAGSSVSTFTAFARMNVSLAFAAPWAPPRMTAAAATPTTINAASPTATTA